MRQRQDGPVYKWGASPSYHWWSWCTTTSARYIFQIHFFVSWEMHCDFLNVFCWGKFYIFIFAVFFIFSCWLLISFFQPTDKNTSNLVQESPIRRAVGTKFSRRSSWSTKFGKKNKEKDLSATFNLYDYDYKVSEPQVYSLFKQKSMNISRSFWWS